MLNKLRATDPCNPLLLGTTIAGRRQIKQSLAIVRKSKGHLKATEHDAPNQLIQMSKLGFLGAQEATARGGVVKQIADFDLFSIRATVWRRQAVLWPAQRQSRQ